MRSILRRVFTVLGLTMASNGAIAADMEQSCLASFNVQDKAFSTGAATMSCSLLEKRRQDLFKAVSQLPSSGSLDGPQLAKQLESLEGALKKAETETNWSGWAIALSGNTLATLGLASCLETAGGGCAVAAVGKALAVAGIIDSAVDSSKKQEASAKLRADIAKLRQQVAAKKPDASKARDALIAEFNGLCSSVRQHCLAK
jgi:hypothetical protein